MLIERRGETLAHQPLKRAQCARWRIFYLPRYARDFSIEPRIVDHARNDPECAGIIGAERRVGREISNALRQPTIRVRNQVPPPSGVSPERV